MMELSRISLVQWHLLSRADLDLGGNSAILGRNRSGKSTLIDLIQAVLAGGSSQFYKFNQSAGETNRRSDRTLLGYCLGQLSEDDRKRDHSITHIALVFSDPFDERPPVTIGLCIEANLQDGVQIVGKYVAPGIRAHTDLMVAQLDTGAFGSAPWHLVRERLEAACKAAGTQLHLNDSPRNHIREYMRLLFTSRRATEPDRFIKAFVSALSFEDMRSVEHFVLNYLLERNHIDIGELRESIQRYREIQRDIHELEQRLEALKALQAEIVIFVDLLEREEIARGVVRLAGLIEAGDALMGLLRDRREKQVDLKDVQAQIERVEDAIKSYAETLESLQGQLNAQDQNSQRLQVTSELRSAEQQRNIVAARLQQRFLAAARATGMLEHRDILAPLKLGELMQLLEQVVAHSAGLVPPNWPTDPYEMERLLEAAGKSAATQSAKVLARRDDAIRWRGEINDKIRELVERRTQAQTGQVALEDRTQRLIETLTKEGMQPRALCQVTEVLDESWRNAAEALLGRDREAILVDPEHASRAVSIIRSGRDAYRGCRVANTRRLAGMSRSAAPGTLASVLKSDDPLAMAYLVSRIGNVELAETQEEMLQSSRAIMRDGAYNSGIVVEVLHTRDLKIGRAAAPLMLADLAKQIEAQRALLPAHEATIALHDDVAKRLEAMALPVQEGEQLPKLVAEIDRLEEFRAALQDRLAKIAATIDPKLLADIESAKRILEEARSDQVALSSQQGGLQTGIKELNGKLSAGEGQPGSWLAFTARRKLFRDAVRSRVQFGPLRLAYAAMRPQPPARIVSVKQREAEAAQIEYRKQEVQIRDDLAQYRVKFGAGGPSGGNIRIVGDIKPWVEEQVTALEENALIQYRRQADEAAERISRLFRTAFVHELNSRFVLLERELDGLTKALRARLLHNEIYTLHRRIKPEFEALYRLAQDSESDDTTFALFGRGAPRDARQAAALAEVERLLSDETLDFTLYEDYRRYFTYDLQMEDITTGRRTSFDKRRGTASGAERQAPYYVIIGAALASIYHGSKRQHDAEHLGLGLAVFDEAFSKMDGPNQRQLLDFYRDIGLQVVIAAPTEKRSVVLENLDSIVDVFRSKDDVTAQVSRLKSHTRDAMRAANPQYLSDEELEQRLGTSAA
jgi:energy-coupling factor transporter ATP-binding protein EcfA2